MAQDNTVENEIIVDELDNDDLFSLMESFVDGTGESYDSAEDKEDTDNILEDEVDTEEGTDTDQEDNIHTDETDDGGVDSEEDDEYDDNSEYDTTENQSDVEDTPITEDDDSTEDDTNKDEEFDIEEFTRLKDFYSKATSDFKANGKLHKGLKQADDITRIQQKALGYDALSKKVSPLKPFMGAMEDAGLLADPEKLNLLIELSKGNKDAFQKYIQQLDINPLDLVTDDEDSTEFSIPNNMESQSVMDYKDFYDDLASSDIADKFNDQIGNSWDVDSITEIVSDPEYRKNIKDHLEMGIFDKVQEVVDYTKRVEGINGEFSKLSSLEQYKKASYMYLDEVRAENAKKSKERSVTDVLIPKKEVQKRNTRKANNSTKAKKAGSATVKTTSTRSTASTQHVDINQLSNAELFEAMEQISRR